MKEREERKRKEERGRKIVCQSFVPKRRSPVEIVQIAKSRLIVVTMSRKRKKKEKK